MSGPLGSHELMYATSSDFYSYQIANSLRGSAAGNTTLKFTAGTPSSTDIMTMSFWVKRHTPDSRDAGANNVFTTGTGGGNYFYIAYNATLTMENSGGNQGTGYLLTEEKYRDASAWYHVILRIDTTQSTQFDRIRVYVNGQQLGVNEAWRNQAMITNTAQNEDFSYLNANGLVQAWGGLSGKGHGTEGADLSLADVMFFDGQSYYAELGETKNGVWIPKDPSGLTFGNNGYWLKFTNSSNLGEDFSGNDNDFTVANFSAHDQMTDTPTNNFCTINPRYRGTDTTDAKYGTISEGNLKISYTNNNDAACPCTIKVPASGKWYFEYLINAGGGTGDYSPGAGIIDVNEYTFNTSAYNAVGSIQYANNVNKVYKGTSVAGTYGGSRGSNDDVMGIAVDMDNGAFYVSKNGTFQAISGGSTGDPTSGASKTGAGATWTPASEFTSGMVPLGAPNGGNVPIITMNFGQDGTFAGEKTAGGNSDENGHGNFFSAVPSGYLAICTANLSVVDEIDPAQTDDDYPQKLFTTLAYSGDGGGSQTTGFQPDLVWVKRRDGSQGHGLFDSTRGTGKVVNSNDNGAQASSNGLTSFNSTGYTMGEYYNQSGNTYVSWSWRVNGGTTATNSNGSVNSTVQVDPSGAFSIATFRGGITSAGTGTVGHGLSKAPSMIIFKGYDNLGGGDGQWWVGHDKLTSWNYFLRFNSHVSEIDKSGNGSMSAPTSTVFSINNTDGLGYSTIDTLAYCFADIEGYCKTGGYAANGNTNGAFVYTGFRPAWVMIKAIDTGAEWAIYDDTRDPHNESDHVLQADLDSAERTDLDEIDILSNGFKCLATGGRTNQSSKNYIFLAFAKNPFKYATAR